MPDRLWLRSVMGFVWEGLGFRLYSLPRCAAKGRAPAGLPECIWLHKLHLKTLVAGMDQASLPGPLVLGLRS